MNPAAPVTRTRSATEPKVSFLYRFEQARFVTRILARGDQRGQIFGPAPAAEPGRVPGHHGVRRVNPRVLQPRITDLLIAHPEGAGYGIHLVDERDPLGPVEIRHVLGQ